MEWENGRQLASIEFDNSVGWYEYFFAYDADGIRTKKFSEEISHSYTTPNGRVVREVIDDGGTYDKVLDFIYDNQGRPLALNYSTNGGISFTTYYYVLNLQGDVIKLVSIIPGFEFATVATYSYDAWGNIITATGDMASINPLRYRGYYYDTETGFYYLQSRYYDPAIHRFINADSYASTGASFIGNNMFAYCGNNPVRHIDPLGNWFWEDAWEWVCDAAEDVREWTEENIVEPVIEFGHDIAEDISNYDSNNQSEDKVYDSNYFSNYKGTFVLKTPFDASFFYGIIGLSKYQQKSDTLNHEYGHSLQMDSLGFWDYTTDIALPSITANILNRMDKLPYDYYGSPWEAEADALGGVQRNNTTPWPQGSYQSIFDLIKMFFE